MTDVPPKDAPEIGSDRVGSLVMVNTGAGRGKSTAAFGTMLRAIARGWRVAVIQFVKSNEWKVGEEQMARKLGVDWWTLGDGFTWDSDALDESTVVAKEAWNAAAAIIATGDHQLVILDEITYAMNWEWIDPQAVLHAVEHRPDRVNLILTGRKASRELIDLADIVTKMRNVKHAYDEGVAARRGIDY
jgi:cob(I)alamin adenosyltransferase